MNGKLFFLWVFLLAAVPASAQMKPKTFAAAKTMTAGELFLDQVDKVSLYLATDRIVYTPHLEEGLRLHMTITLLETEADAPSESLQNFIVRHIETFKKTLNKRLKLYTSDLAKEFDAKRDISFLIQAGAQRQKVASVQGDRWEWLIKDSKVKASRSKKDCPALRKKR